MSLTWLSGPKARKTSSRMMSRGSVLSRMTRSRSSHGRGKRQEAPLSVDEWERGNGPHREMRRLQGAVPTCSGLQALLGLRGGECSDA